MQGGGSRTGSRTQGVAFDQGHRTASQADAGPGAPGFSMGQWQAAGPVWLRLRPVDTANRSRVAALPIWREFVARLDRRDARAPWVDGAKAAATRTYGNLISLFNGCRVAPASLTHRTRVAPASHLSTDATAGRLQTGRVPGGNVTNHTVGNCDGLKASPTTADIVLSSLRTPNFFAVRSVPETMGFDRMVNDSCSQPSGRRCRSIA